VVWYPRIPEKGTGAPLDERLKQVICEVYEEHQEEIEDLEVMADHVQLLVSLDPRFGIRRLMNARERQCVSYFAPGISCVETEIADFVDEL
jgi:putative transposase